MNVNPLTNAHCITHVISHLDQLATHFVKIAEQTTAITKKKRKLEEQRDDLAKKLSTEKRKSEQAKRDLELVKESSSRQNDNLALAVDALKALQKASEKKKVEQKREFEPNGVKTEPAAYNGMMANGLLNISRVDPKCREMIAKDQMVDLFALLPTESYSAVTHKRTVTTVDETTGETHTVTTESPEIKAQPQRGRPEIFRMLYVFGEVYLQVYPTKTMGFFEILGFLTKYAAGYPLAIFTKLERDIRGFYVANPALCWNITHPEIQEFIREADLEQKKLILEQQKAANHSQNSYHSNYTYSSPQNFTKQPRKSLDFGSSPKGTPRKERRERCNNWSFRECKKDCGRDHVCWYCGGNHRGDKCKRHQPRRR